MPDLHPIHQAYFDAMAEDNPMAVIPVGQTVLCDDCDRDYTSDTATGGLLFQSKAIGPCCSAKWQRQAEHHGEERFIRDRCPEGTSFAEWVRGMRAPDAAITVGPFSGWLAGGED